MTCKTPGRAAKLALLVSLVLCPAAFASATSAEETSEGPVAVVTADPASQVDLHNVTEVQSPAPPAGVLIDRPTVPLARYLAAKQGSSGGQRPGAPEESAPLATNILGFNGITQATAGGGVPPDINGAVSLVHVAEIVNLHLTSFLKSNGSRTSDRSLAAITGYTTKSLTDPRLLYDPTWQRWVASVEALPENSTTQFVFLLISKSNDPGGEYLVYKLNFGPVLCGAGNLLDYPQLGMTQDAVVLTGTCFSSAEVLGARTFGVAKAQLYNGLGFSVPVFKIAAADGTVTPSQVLDNNPNMELLTRNGPTGEASAPHDVTFKNPANGFYAKLTPDKELTGFTTPSIPPAAGQKGCKTTECQLDTSDGRFVAPSTQTGTQLWNVATYGLKTTEGTFATPTWAQFNTKSKTTTQKGTAFSDSCSDDFNASLVAQTNGSMWLNWTSTNPEGRLCSATFVRQLIATRKSSDPVGTLPSVIKPFTSSFELTGDFQKSFGRQRWGDTSSTSLDPSNPAIAWTWNESVAGSSNWGTRAQEVSNP
jgi:hypothetical protein